MVFYIQNNPRVGTIIIFILWMKNIWSPEKVNNSLSVIENRYIYQDLNILTLNQDMPECQIWDSLHILIYSIQISTTANDRGKLLCNFTLSLRTPGYSLRSARTHFFLKKVPLTSAVIWNNNMNWRWWCQSNSYLVWQRLKVTRVPEAFEILRKLQVNFP